MSEKTDKRAIGFFDSICAETEEELEEERRKINRSKLKNKFVIKLNELKVKVIEAKEAITKERKKVKDNYEGYDISVIIKAVFEIKILTGVNYYEEGSNASMTEQYVIEQEYIAAFGEDLNG